MRRSRWVPVAISVVLLNCSSKLPTPADPLEAKAQNGDPVASCKLAVGELQACAREKLGWEDGEIATRPACIGQGISRQHQAYLDNAIAGYKEQSVERITLITTQVMLAAEAVMLKYAPTVKSIETLDGLQKNCTELSNPSRT